MSTLSITGPETILLFAFRTALFYGARKYLLRSLYHDLQDLSSDGPSTITTQIHPDSDVELETLPTPSTAGAKAHDAFLIVKKGTFHSMVSRTTFALCFSECCTLFLLLMFQALDVLHPWTRLLNWRISLSLLLALIVAIIPLAYSLVLSYRSTSGLHGLQRPSFARIIVTAFPVGLFLFLLSFIPLPAGVVSSSTSTSNVVLARLTVVGTVILGALSGFGAANNIWRFSPSLSRRTRKLPTDREVAVTEEGLQRVRADLTERRKSIARLEASQPAAKGSWLTKVVPNFRGDNQITNAMQEIAGLEALEYQMSRNLVALKQQQNDAAFNKTFTGRLFNFGGSLFAVYCVYRVIVSVVNIVLPARPVEQLPSTTPTLEDTPLVPAPRTDFVTVLLAYLLSLLPGIHFSLEDVAVMSRQISLILVGVIILSSIRLVLRGVAKALRVTSRNLGASLMLLILAQLMGIYLLSTLVQLRTSFPPPLSRPDAIPDTGEVNLFSTLPEYQVFGAVFDGSFLITAGLSAFVRWFNSRINSGGAMDSET